MMNKKRCPLFTIALSITLKNEEVEAQACLQEMCQLWDELNCKCGLVK